MLLTFSFAASLGAATVALTLQSTPALALPTQPQALHTAAAQGTPAEPIQWAGRCRYWANVCAARWGWGTPRHFWCMGRHAC